MTQDQVTRIVIDTSVLVAALFNSKSKQILEGWQAGKWTVCFSQPMRNEYEKILMKIPPIRQKADEFFSLLERVDHTEQIEKPPVADVDIEDQDDLKFVSCALEAGADYIISLDEHLLSLGKIENTQVLSPGDFLRANEG